MNEIDFKVVIVNMFKELKETMFKELKESTTMNQQIEILNKEIQIIFFKKEPNRILKLKNTIITIIIVLIIEIQ